MSRSGFPKKRDLRFDAEFLVEGHGGHDVGGGRDELDLDGALGDLGFLALEEGLLDGVDALVGEAGALEVCSDFGGRR